ncbi:MAG: hypothetical protein JWL98_152 [Xanthomonadaceae bacterium]|nr:hypothetical protein [Xanthomonadaceae bacterium]
MLLTLTASGGRIEYDCGQGTIDAPLRPDAGGAFSVRGTHLQGHGGPARVQEDEPTSTAVPANYSGTVNGDTMRLRVTSNGDELGTYTLRRGADPQMVHCL